MITWEAILGFVAAVLVIFICFSILYMFANAAVSFAQFVERCITWPFRAIWRILFPRKDDD